MTSSELSRLDELAPIARPHFEALLRGMQRRGFNPYVGTVGRTPMQQLRAILDGTTSKKQALSWHLINRAVDFRRRLADGTRDPTTDGPEDFWRALYEEATAIPGMRSLAYKSGAPTWEKLLLNGTTWDPGHVEFRAPYLTLKEAVRAEAPHLLA